MWCSLLHRPNLPTPCPMRRAAPSTPNRVKSGHFYDPTWSSTSPLRRDCSRSSLKDPSTLAVDPDCTMRCAEIRSWARFARRLISASRACTMRAPKKPLLEPSNWESRIGPRPRGFWMG
ncbi:hypothetical protein IE81DRAFT_214904 [Ceraceosorus guamensis]|uniref:Uncharacterized protein n=1 Tax=Ceraceosorus guamensis TaxID=1522189 RepID=A0A316VSL1_9BASI|nr:hypothetical protein IE81DRAFT_214904 [Ceraceosorus guamensis]PWN40629.1 hypothetical protein IE81DRAFT_214904 [Ceraceosorus guamensis]